MDLSHEIEYYKEWIRVRYSRCIYDMRKKGTMCRGLDCSANCDYKYMDYREVMLPKPENLEKAEVSTIVEEAKLA